MRKATVAMALFAVPLALLLDTSASWPRIYFASGLRMFIA
jgi:hypothetical protein